MIREEIMKALEDGADLNGASRCKGGCSVDDGDRYIGGMLLMIGVPECASSVLRLRFAWLMVRAAIGTLMRSRYKRVIDISIQVVEYQEA